MAADVLSEDLLRISLARLTNEVVKTHPQFRDVLASSLVRTCGLVPDVERAAHYDELGMLLTDLGRLYRAEAQALRSVPGESGVVDTLTAPGPVL